MQNMQPMCSLHTLSFLDAATDHTQNVEIRPTTPFLQVKWYQNRMQTCNCPVSFLCPISSLGLERTSDHDCCTGKRTTALVHLPA